MQKTKGSEAIAVRIPRLFYNELEETRKQNDLSNLGSALLLYVENKAQEKAQEILEKAKVMELVDKVGYAAYLSQLSQVIGRVLCKKYPGLIKKSKPAIEKEIKQVFTSFPEPIRQSIRRYAEKEGWLPK